MSLAMLAPLDQCVVEYHVWTDTCFCSVLLQLFLENLDHEDSFVYLSAIQGERILGGSRRFI